MQNSHAKSYIYYKFPIDSQIKENKNPNAMFTVIFSLFFRLFTVILIFFTNCCITCATCHLCIKDIRTVKFHNEMTVLCAISSSVRTVRHRHRIINDNT